MSLLLLKQTPRVVFLGPHFFDDKVIRPWRTRIADCVSRTYGKTNAPESALFTTTDRAERENPYSLLAFNRFYWTVDGPCASLRGVMVVSSRFNKSVAVL